MKRVFFDWNRPFLPAVAEYVVATEKKQVQNADAFRLDLGKFVYVLPGRRAARTLEAYLVKLIKREVDEKRLLPDWTPPRFQTLGDVAETLCPPIQRPPERLTRLYCAQKALDEFFSLPLEETDVLARDPGKKGRLKLAETLLSLKDELESECKTYAQVADYCRTQGQEEEARRWGAIAKLDSIYEALLKSNRLMERNKSRRLSLDSVAERAGCNNGEPREFRILGAVDLNAMQKRIFERLGERVEFWVFAPESEADNFDEFGCVLPDAWEYREIPLDVSQLFQVDSRLIRCLRNIKTAS